MPTVTVHVLDSDADKHARALGLLVPQAISTEHQTFEGLECVGGWSPQILAEKTSGQCAVLLSGCSDTPILTYSFSDNGIEKRPEDFARFDNRYTRASLEMRQIIENLVDENPVRTAQNIVTHTASLFDYGHPDERFNDGHDEVPVIACGTAKGSCIDINTYLISAMRVAGISTVYFAGYFFPEERGGITTDMHCWVATWMEDDGTGGHWLEWDIAHHMKMGLGPEEVRPAYNPKPGVRQAITYGRGLRFDVNGFELTLSHLSEPMWVYPDGRAEKAKIKAHYADEVSPTATSAIAS